MPVFVLYLVFSVITWGNTPDFFKYPVKIGDTVKSCQHGYVCNTFTRSRQQHTGPVNAQLVNVFKDPHVQCIFKTGTQVALIHHGYPGQLVQFQLFQIMLMYIIQNRLKPCKCFIPGFFPLCLILTDQIDPVELSHK